MTYFSLNLWSQILVLSLLFVNYGPIWTKIDNKVVTKVIQRDVFGFPFWSNQYPTELHPVVLKTIVNKIMGNITVGLHLDSSKLGDW